jgi:hypothetical protein
MKPTAKTAAGVSLLFFACSGAPGSAQRKERQFQFEQFLFCTEDNNRRQ